MHKKKPLALAYSFCIQNLKLVIVLLFFKDTYYSSHFANIYWVFYSLNVLCVAFGGWGSTAVAGKCKKIYLNMAQGKKIYILF